MTAPYYAFTVQRVEPDSSMNYRIDGQDHIFSSGALVYTLVFVDVTSINTCLFAGEVVFDSSNNFDLSLNHLGNSFNFSIYRDRNNPSLDFVPASSIGCYFYYDDYSIDNNFNGNGSGGTSEVGFFTSLNGKYGSFPDGTSVTVANREGVFKVKSSEMFWNDDEKKAYMLAYILTDSSGNFLMCPDTHIKKHDVLA